MKPDDIHIDEMINRLHGKVGRLLEDKYALLAALKTLLHNYDQLIGDGVVIENQPDERRAAVAAIAKAEAQ